MIDLTPGQRRVLLAFDNRSPDCTYASVAASLSLHVGTVKRHLSRIRASSPEAYRAFQTMRGEQLGARQVRSASRANAHSRRWFRGKRARERG